MSEADALPSSIFRTYQDLLRELTEAAMTLVRRVHAESQPEAGESPVLTFDLVVRHQVVLSLIVRRAVVVSQYLATLPAPLEEQQGQISQRLDRVFAVFAVHQMDADAYHAALDEEIDGDDEDDDEFDDEFDDEDDENDDVPGRPPAALVAELCRDIGMAMNAVPTAWSDPVPTELRLLCLRAATAAIRPSTPDGRLGYSIGR